METKKQDNKVALITGVTSGIGRQLTYLFAEDGYDLVLVARNMQKLNVLEEELRNKYPVDIHGIIKDLSEPSSPQEIFEEVQQRGIAIDVLVNNAGFNVYGSLHKTELLEQQKLIQVNLITPTHLTRLLLPGMLECRRGKIMFIGSTGSFAPSAYDAIYCATKAYILSFAEGVMNANVVAQTGYRALMDGKSVVIAGIFNKLQIQAMKFTPRFIIAPLTRCIMSER